MIIENILFKDNGFKQEKNLILQCYPLHIIGSKTHKVRFCKRKIQDITHNINKQRALESYSKDHK